MRGALGSPTICPQGTLAGASQPGVGPSARLCLSPGPQSPEPISLAAEDPAFAVRGEEAPS